MKIPVIIAGYNRIGKRVADAVAAQPDMEVRGVLEDDERNSRLIHARGHQLLRASPALHLDKDTVVVHCSKMVPPVSRRTILAPRISPGDTVPGFSALSPRDLFRRHGRIRVVTANTLAIARVAAALRRCGPIRRWYATSIMPSVTSPLVDGLDPLESDAHEDRELTHELAGIVPDIRLARVAAPCTHSILHMMKIDFEEIIARGEALEALSFSPRIIVGHAGDGWKSTADLREYCRDLGRPRGDRPEVFIWHESIHAAERTLYLMMDVEPDATPVPEMIDAIRLMANSSMTVSACASITDHALQIGAAFKAFNPSMS